MSVLGSYVHCIEAERLKQKAQIQRMCEENSWLRDELASTQQRLQRSEQRCAALDERNSHLEFLSELNNYELQSAATEVGLFCGTPHVDLLWSTVSIVYYLCRRLTSREGIVSLVMPKILLVPFFRTRCICKLSDDDDFWLFLDSLHNFVLKSCVLNLMTCMHCS